MGRRAENAGVNTDPLFSKAVVLYCRDREQSGRLNERTLKRVRPELRRFANFVDKPLKAVTTQDVQRYIDTKRAVGTKYSTQSDLKQFFRWCEREKLRSGDPCIGVKLPRRPSAAPRSLPLLDVQKVLAVADTPRERLIVMLMLRMGLRAIEVTRLDLGDVEFTMAAPYASVWGKGDKRVQLPIPEDVVPYIERYLDEHPATAGPLIRSYTTGRALHPKTISHIMTGIFYKAGVKGASYDGKSGHALRHTLATNMARRGAPITAVRDILRHENISTTQRYVGGLDPTIRKWMNEG